MRTNTTPLFVCNYVLFRLPEGEEKAGKWEEEEREEKGEEDKKKKDGSVATNI